MVDIPLAPSASVASAVAPPSFQDAPRQQELEKAFGSQVGDGFSSVAQSMDKINQANGRSQAALVTTQGDLDLQQKMIDDKMNAQPGAPGFSQGTIQGVQDYYQQQLKNVQNPYAQQAIQEHMQRSVDSFGTQAMQYEAGQQVDLRLQQNDTAISNMAKSLSVMAPKDADAAYPMQVGKMTDLVNGEMMPGNIKQQKISDYTRQLQQSVMQNYSVNDNTGFMQSVASLRAPGAIAASPGNTPGLTANNPGNIKSSPLPPLAGTAPAQPGEGNFAGNNAGNLMDSPENNWQGKIGVDSRGLVHFATPEDGLRAMAKTLKNKGGNDDINTVTDLVNSYATPGKENPNDANYIAMVSKAVGVSPTDTVDFTDPAVLQKVMPAMIQFEHGKNPYSDSMISDAINGTDANAASTSVVKGSTGNDSITGSQMAPAVNAIDAQNGQPPSAGDLPVPKTGIKAFDDASYEDQQKYIAHAEDLSRRQNTQQIKDLDKTVEGNYQMAAQGITSQDVPTIQDFKTAYGANWQEQYQDYNDRMGVAKDSYSVLTMSDAQQKALSDHYHNLVDPGDAENFDENQKRAAIIDQAISSAQVMRRTQPVELMQQLGQIPKTPLNWNDPQQVQDRVSSMTAFSQQYGSPLIIMSKQEGDGLKQMLSTQSADANTSLLQSLADNVRYKPALSSIMQTIAGEKPEAAYAGMLMGLNVEQPRQTIDSSGKTVISGYQMAGDAGRDIMKGLSLMNPTKGDQESDGKKGIFMMPKDMDSMPEKGNTFAKDWNAGVGDAYAANPEAEAQAYKAAKAIYAFRATDAGAPVGQYSTTVGKQAIYEAIGTVGQQGAGHKVLLPYGMDQSTFQDISAQQYTNFANNYSDAIKRQGTDAPSALPKFQATQLIATDTPGVYNIRSGTDFVKDINGKNAVLDVNAGGIGARGHFAVTPPSHLNNFLKSAAGFSDLKGEPLYSGDYGGTDAPTINSGND